MREQDIYTQIAQNAASLSPEGVRKIVIIFALASEECEGGQSIAYRYLNSFDNKTLVPLDFSMTPENISADESIIDLIEELRSIYKDSGMLWYGCELCIDMEQGQVDARFTYDRISIDDELKPTFIGMN